MLTVRVERFEDLSDEEKNFVPENGSGSAYAGYLRVVHNGETILLESDAMEPEDAIFARDLNWIALAIKGAYNLGRAEKGERC